jgi:acylphosphatase
MTVAKTALVRRRVFYSGRVQGVGFRYTTRSLASGFAIAGYVRNLADGRVELVIEGESAEVAACLRTIQSELGHYIRQIDDQPISGGDTLTGFEIRY